MLPPINFGMFFADCHQQSVFGVDRYTEAPISNIQ